MANRIFLLDHLLSDWRLARMADCVLEGRGSQLQEAAICDNDTRATLPLATLQTEHEADLVRQYRMEEKAKVVLIGMTVAFTVFFAGFGFLAPGANRLTSVDTFVLKLALLLPLLFSASYLLFAIIAALKVLSVRPVHVFRPKDHLTCADDKARALLYLRFTELNQLTTIRMTNWLSVSHLCMRNGILAATIYLVILSVIILT